MDDYDPRFQDDPRRRRRPENEADDAWAAAEEDSLADPDSEIEDLAAGYEWNDPDELFSEPPLQPRTDSRPVIPSTPVTPSEPPTGGSYHPARGYPTQGPISSEPVFDPYRPPRRPEGVGVEPAPHPGCLAGLPLWGIVLIVILSLVALLVVVLAFASLRLLLG